MRYCIFFVFALIVSCAKVEKKQAEKIKYTTEIKVEVNVHPGVELLTVIQKLSGKFPKSTPSKYNDEVMRYFSKYKNAKAVKILQSIENRLYPDFTELGFCFSDFPNFELNIPENADWYTYYTKEKVQAFLKSSKDFAIETNFYEFYKKYKEQYQSWGEPIRKGLKKDQLIEKLNDFYKSSGKPPKFYICLDPLNGWGAHAIVNPESYNKAYTGVKAYTLGYFGNKDKNDTNLSFSYGDYSTNLVWHEGGHIFLEPIFNKYKKEIDALSYLFNKDDQGMKNQNISNWEYCLNENVVRGVVIALFKTYKSERAWKKQNAKEIVSDFIYAEFISEHILANYLKGNTYPSFESYFPELLITLKKKFTL